MAANSKEGRAGMREREREGAVPDDPSQSNPGKQTHQKSSDARYHVEVKPGQQPMPSGLEQVLDMLSKNLR